MDRRERRRGAVLIWGGAAALLLFAARGYRVWAVDDGRYAVSVERSSVRKTGNAHADPKAALGEPDGSFVSLGGPGRYLVLRMGAPVADRYGEDLMVHETWGWDRYRLLAGLRPDGPFVSLGTAEGSGLFDLASAGIPSCLYVRIEDLSDGIGPAPGTDLDAVEAVRSGTVHLEIRDAATGNLIPGRATFVGLAPTPDPAWRGVSAEEPSPTLHRSGSRVHTARGRETFPVPFGTYVVTVSHGPEYELSLRQVTVGEAPLKIDAVLARSVETPGFVAADLHVHSARSFDSTITEDPRAISILSEGLEVVVLSDHDFVSDLSGALSRLGQPEAALVIPGQEVTGRSHFNGFPLPVVPGHPRGGAIEHLGLLPSQIFAAIRSAAPGEEVVQVNHPRLGVIGYFNHHFLDPQTGLSPDPSFSAAFDAVEALNSLLPPIHEEGVLRDWCNLTNRGILATVTGNSDSHRTAWNGAGFPRTWLQVPAEGPPGTIPVEDVVAALRGRRAVASYGPYVELRANGAYGIGELVPDPDGQVDLEIRVQAPLWMDVDRVEVFAGGMRVLSFPPDTPSAPVRFHRILSLPVLRDTWFHVRAAGSRTLWPVAPGMFPFAVTNGIFVDTDGNGRFDP